MARAWRVRLSVPAERDLREIVAWTSSRFGAEQGRVYRKTLTVAIDTLHDGPTPLGSKRRSDLGEGLFLLHVARAGRRGRHFLLYRAVAEDTIEIARVLHDAMDLSVVGRPWGAVPPD